MSYSAGHHHSLHTDYLMPPKPVKAKTVNDVSFFLKLIFDFHSVQGFPNCNC